MKGTTAYLKYGTTKISFTEESLLMRTMYVDGKRVASKSGVQFNPEDLGVTHVWLGRSIFNDPYFNGRMDDVRFYSRALSTTEINKLRNFW